MSSDDDLIVLMLSRAVGSESRIVGSVDLSEDGTRSSTTTTADLNER